MPPEILLKDYEEAKNYCQEMALVEKTGILEFIKKELKKKDVSIKISPEGKYFAEISWPLKKEENKVIFENVISLLPNAEKETLTIIGSFSRELKKEEWSNQKILKKTIREAFKNPSPRSNSPFYEAEDPLLLDNKDKIGRIEKEVIEYHQSSSFSDRKEFLALLEKNSGKDLVSLFKAITDRGSRTLCDFETEENKQKFSGTKIKGASKEKLGVGFRPLITLNFLPETGDVFLKFFPQAHGWKWDLIIFTNIKNDSGIDYKLKLLDGDNSDYACWLRNILSSLVKVKNFSRTSA